MKGLHTMKQYKHSRQTIVISVNSETYKAAAAAASKQQIRLQDFMRRILLRELSGLKRFD
jgi:hypothetical protein